MSNAHLYLQQAQDLLESENYQESRIFFNLALEHASIEQNDQVTADSYIGLAVLSMFHNDDSTDPIEERRRLCSMAISILQNSAIAISLARALRIRSNTYLSEEEERSSDINASLRLLQDGQFPKEHSLALMSLALDRIHSSDPASGVALLHNALSLARQSACRDTIAVILSLIAKYDDLPRASRQRVFDEAQSLFRLLNRRRKLAILLVDEALMADTPSEVKVRNLTEAIELFTSLSLTASAKASQELLVRLST